MPFRLRLVPTVLTLSATALLLSGCISTDPAPRVPTPTGTPTAAGTPTTTTSPTPSSSPTMEPEPAATSAPAPKPTPVALSCGEIISPQAMYDFNPSFLLLGSFTPPAGSTAHTAVAAKGVACRWENSTSGITIDVSVAKPASSDMDGLRRDAGSPTSSFDGYFGSVNGAGTAQIFSGDYWATISSPAFLNAKDPAQLAAEVRSALK